MNNLILPIPMRHVLKFLKIKSTVSHKQFLVSSDSFGGEWDRGDNEILTKMLGSINITTNTENIMFLQRI